MDEFLSKSISKKISKISGFDVEASVYRSENNLRISLKVIKKGYPIYSSCGFWKHTLEAALEKTFKSLESEMYKTEQLPNKYKIEVDYFIKRQISFKSLFEGCNKFNSLSYQHQDIFTLGITDRSESLKDALIFVDENYFMLINRYINSLSLKKEHL